MSVYGLLLGRELPRSASDLLRIAPAKLLPPQREQQKRLGGASGDRSDPMYQQGLCHLRRGQLGLARRSLQQLAARQPCNISARIALAISCERLAQHECAAMHLAAAGAMTSDGGRQATLLCASGLAWERAGNQRSASRQYGEAMTHRPCPPFALHRLVAIHLANSHGSVAILHLRSILGQSPADQAVRLCLGHLLLAMGRAGEAAWEYEQALCLQPDNWGPSAEVSTHLRRLSRGEQAIDVLEALVADQPHCPDLRMRLGNLYSHMGSDERARIQYQQALAIHPAYLECHIAMARHELRMGRTQSAAAAYAHALTTNEQNVEAYVGLGLALRRNGDVDRGTESLISAARIAGNTAILLAQLAVLEEDAPHACVELATGDLRPEWIQSLIERDGRILEQHPDHCAIRVRQAILNGLLGYRGRAIEALHAAVAAEPNSHQAWMHLGLALREADQDEAAETALCRSVELDRTWAELHYRLGLICCGGLEFDLAMERLAEAAETTADAPERIWSAVTAMQLSPACAVEAPLRPAAPAMRDGG